MKGPKLAFLTVVFLEVISPSQYRHRPLLKAACTHSLRYPPLASCIITRGNCIVAKQYNYTHLLYRMYCTVRSCTGTALVPNLRNTAHIMNGASIDHACSCGAHTTLLEVHISQQSEGRVVQWHPLLPRPHTCFVQRALRLLTVKAPHSCRTEWSPVHAMPCTDLGDTDMSSSSLLQEAKSAVIYPSGVGLAPRPPSLNTQWPASSPGESLLPRRQTYQQAASNDPASRLHPAGEHHGHGGSLL